MKLTETFSLNLTETKISKIENNRRRVERAKAQHCNVINKNKRRYPYEKTWGRHVKEGTAFMSKVVNREVFGHIEHPQDGRADLNKAAIIVEKVWMEGDEVFINFATLSTTPGKTIASLIDDKLNFGLSSRATGSIKTCEDGVDEVQEDFEPETWDAVADPSVGDARVTEEVKKRLTEAYNQQEKETLAEGKDVPGQRDETGPFAGSAQAAVSDVGKNQAAGLPCPNKPEEEEEEPEKEKDKEEPEKDADKKEEPEKDKKEEGTASPTRMTIQEKADALFSTGMSHRQVTRELEKEFNLKRVTISPAKTVVFFEMTRLSADTSRKQNEAILDDRRVTLYISELQGFFQGVDLHDTDALADFLAEQGLQVRHVSKRGVRTIFNFGSSSDAQAFMSLLSDYGVGESADTSRTEVFNIGTRHIVPTLPDNLAHLEDQYPEHLFHDVSWDKHAGMVSITVGEEPAAKALSFAIQKDVPTARVKLRAHGGNWQIRAVGGKGWVESVRPSMKNNLKEDESIQIAAATRKFIDRLLERNKELTKALAEAQQRISILEEINETMDDLSRLSEIKRVRQALVQKYPALEGADHILGKATTIEELKKSARDILIVLKEKEKKQVQPPVKKEVAKEKASAIVNTVSEASVDSATETLTENFGDPLSRLANRYRENQQK